MSLHHHGRTRIGGGDAGSLTKKQLQAKLKVQNLNTNFLLVNVTSPAILC